jgi:hypothetical protein
MSNVRGVGVQEDSVSQLASHSSPGTVLRNYFHAKDENRPHLLKDVFSADADLEVVNSTTSIAFPAVTHGREAITEVLVRRFAQTYENIYSYYLSNPPEQAPQFSCGWLVGMTERDTKNVRVGCGRYDWTFQAEVPYLASRLVITIEAMQVLPPSHFEPVFEWLGRLSYPWSSVADVASHAPSFEPLAPVLQCLGHT